MAAMMEIKWAKYIVKLVGMKSADITTKFNVANGFFLYPEPMRSGDKSFTSLI